MQQENEAAGESLEGVTALSVTLTYNSETYRTVSEERSRRLLAFLHETEWNAVKEQSGTRIWYTEDTVKGIRIIRGQTVVPASAKTVSELVAHLENLPVTDAMAVPEHIRRVEDFDEVSLICWARFKLPFPFYPRDFVYAAGLEWIETEKDGLVGINWAYSLVDSRAPEVDGVVRAEILESGYIIQDLKNGTCMLDYIVQANPRGWIPLWVVNMVATDQAQNCTRIREFFEEHGDYNPRPPGGRTTMSSEQLMKKGDDGSSQSDGKKNNKKKKKKKNRKNKNKNNNNG